MLSSPVLYNTAVAFAVSQMDIPIMRARGLKTDGGKTFRNSKSSSSSSSSGLQKSFDVLQS